METIEIYDDDLLEALEYRVREIEWEVSDRFFNAPIERYRIKRFLNKHVEHLKNRDPLFAEYHRLILRLERARKMANEVIRNMMCMALNQQN